jgi:lipid A 4'-phosphatase
MAAIYRAILVGVLASILVFTFFPWIDVETTRLFYRPGEGFPLSELGWVDTVRRIHMRLAWAAGIAALVLWIGLALRARRRDLGLMIWLQDRGGAAGRRAHLWLAAAGRLLARWGVLDLPPRKALYVLLCLLLGPGLLVNVVLKDNWGRARPSQTIEFGGTQAYSPPFTRSDQCVRNCSFVSGEVSLGFWWLSFAFAAPRRHRAGLAAAAIALGTVFGLIRVAEGGHFLSDAVMSALLTAAVCALLRDVMALDRAPPAPAVGAPARPV